MSDDPYTFGTFFGNAANQWGQAAGGISGAVGTFFGNAGNQYASLFGSIGNQFHWTTGQTNSVQQAVSSQIPGVEAIGAAVEGIQNNIGHIGEEIQNITQFTFTPPERTVQFDNPFQALASGWASAWPWLVASAGLAVGVGVIEQYDRKTALTIGGVTFLAVFLSHPNIMQDIQDLINAANQGLSNAGINPTSSGPISGTTTGNRPIIGSISTVPSGSLNTVLGTAQSKLGSRYVFGANGPTAFDCSGLVQWAFAQAGITLSRTTQTQFNQGRPVAQGSLRPGDVVFFRDTDGPGITHDGIYIGNNQFIHASDPNTGVITSSLSNQYWTQHYAGARRYQ